MKRKHLFFTLVALAGLALTACTKEPKAEPADYTVQYCIDGNLQQTVLTDDGELGDFVLGLMPYVRDGHVVVLVNDDSNPQAKSDVVTFRTASDTAAATWATEKYLQGYTVTVSFDTETSEYVCIAYSKEMAHYAIPSTLAGTTWSGEYYWGNCIFTFEADSTGTFAFMLNNSRPAELGVTTYTYDPETGFLTVTSYALNSNRLILYYELEYDIQRGVFIHEHHAIYSRVN